MFFNLFDWQYWKFASWCITIE